MCPADIAVVWLLPLESCQWPVLQSGGEQRSENVVVVTVRYVTKRLTQLICQYVVSLYWWLRLKVSGETLNWLINPLALELDIYSSAHRLCKM